MKIPHCLSNQPVQIVLDCGVAINIIASGCPLSALRSFPGKIITPDAVYQELKYKTGYDESTISRLEEIVNLPTVEIMPCDESMEDQFLELVVGHPSNALADSEAETIAIANSIDAIMATDEKKIQNLCRHRYPHLAIIHSTDIMFFLHATRSVNSVSLKQMILTAMADAHMKINGSLEDYL